MRFILAAALLLAACSKGDDKVAENAVMPPISVTSETPGDWTELDGMVDRTPAESGLMENSPVTVDVNATLGPEAPTFRTAMMRAGKLVRQGDLLVAKGPDAWLVLQPRDHAFRAGLRSGSGWHQWQTPGADVPAPAAL